MWDLIGIESCKYIIIPKLGELLFDKLFNQFIKQQVTTSYQGNITQDLIATLKRWIPYHEIFQAKLQQNKLNPDKLKLTQTLMMLLLKHGIPEIMQSYHHSYHSRDKIISIDLCLVYETAIMNKLRSNLSQIICNHSSTHIKGSIEIDINVLNNLYIHCFKQIPKQMKIKILI